MNTRCPWEVIKDKYQKLEKHLEATISADLVGKFTDYASKLPDAELDDFLKIFDNVNLSENAFKAWEKLANRPEWVRKNQDLLKKLDDKPDNIIDKVAEYYEKTIPSNTPSGFNGAGVYGQVEFNEFGHPKLLPHVSDPNHIVTINMKGNYTSDMTDAKNALITQSFNGDASKIRKAIDPNTGKEASGWSPFQIQQADGSWSEPYTWHHHQNGSSMYPVKKSIHDSITGKHTGGREIVTKYPDLIGFFNEQ